MQTSMTFAVDNRLPEILDRVRSLFAARSPVVTEPLSQLVFAIIAEGAAPSVGLAVYNRLRATFPRWSDLRDASAERVGRVLVGVPGAVAKAEALPALLRAIEAERGVIELDFLRRMTTETAGRWLEKLPGVNGTVAAAVLSFSDLKRPVVAIGKEGARPIRRLGLAPASAPLSALPRHVAERAPSGWRAEEFADLGRGMARIARTVCIDGKPDCSACPLRDLCPSANRQAADVVAFPGPRAAPAVRTARSARS
jgi:endonuclease-3